MKPLEPIYTTELFPKIESELIALLKSLSDEDWQKPTVCVGWSVKDIAAHLLDTSFRRLSMQRDGYFGEKGENLNSYQDLVAFLNRLNADWVCTARRLSPQILISLLEKTGREVYELLKTLDHHDKAIFSVAWADEEVSENWFDIAREYTERWYLGTDTEGSSASEVLITQEIAWRVFTKGIDKEEARKQITITGDEKLGEVILNTLAVMA
jgi:hypothetical protein